MSKTALWIPIVIMAVAGGALFFTPFWDRTAPPPVEIETLDAWVALSQRPGFALLDKEALDDYFIATYRTEGDELAFCYRWRGEGETPDTSLAVRDEQQDSVRCAERSDNPTALNPTGPLPAGGFVHGMVIPIRKDHEGLVITAFRDNRGEPDAIPGRSVYLSSVEWTK